MLVWKILKRPIIYVESFKNVVVNKIPTGEVWVSCVVAQPRRATHNAGGLDGVGAPHRIRSGGALRLEQCVHRLRAGGWRRPVAWASRG